MKICNTNYDYADREGQNLFPDVENPYTSSKNYKCKKCGKVKTLKSTNLFPPFCHGHPMKFEHIIENYFDFSAIAKRLIAASKAKLVPVKKAAKKTKAKPAKKASKKVAKKIKTKKAKKRK